MAEGERHHRRPVPLREAEHLPAHGRPRDTDQLVARLVSIEDEHRHHDAQVAFEVALGTEHLSTDARVETISADDKIEIPRGAAREMHHHAVAAVLDRVDGDTEQCLDATIKARQDDRREVRPRDAEKPAVRAFRDTAGVHPGDRLAPVIDLTQLPHRISHFRESRDNPHAFRDVESGPQKSMR